MKKDIKLIVFDIDGTLVNDKKEMLDENVTAIKKLKEKGIKIVLNSGRTFNGMWRMRQKLDLMAYDDYSICGTGAFVRRNADGKALISNPLGKKDYEKIKSLVGDEDLQITIHTMNILYLNAEVPNDAFLYDQWQVSMPWFKFEKFEDIEDSICRIALAGEKDLLDKFTEENKKELVKDYKIMRNEKRLLEILNKNSGKSESLKKLAQMLGIDRENIMYFGDGMNDVKSLDFAGCGVAMDSGMKEAQDAADFVIGSNEEPSISEFLREYFNLDV